MKLHLRNGSTIEMPLREYLRGTSVPTKKKKTRKRRSTLMQLMVYRPREDNERCRVSRLSEIAEGDLVYLVAKVAQGWSCKNAYQHDRWEKLYKTETIVDALKQMRYYVVVGMGEDPKKVVFIVEWPS